MNNQDISPLLNTEVQIKIIDSLKEIIIHILDLIIENKKSKG